MFGKDKKSKDKIKFYILTINYFDSEEKSFRCKSESSILPLVNWFKSDDNNNYIYQYTTIKDGDGYLNLRKELIDYIEIDETFEKE